MLPFGLGIGGGGGGGGADIGDNIPYSLMLDSTASQYLSRTFGTPTNNLKYTLHIKFKRAGLGSAVQTLFGASSSNLIKFNNTASDNRLLYEVYNGAGADYYIWDVGTHADPSAFYNLTIIYDSANATQADRMIMYWGNTRVTGFSGGSAWLLNAASTMNSATLHLIGAYPTPAGFADLYIAQVIFVDGQALVPTNFLRQSADTGQWVNKNYTGTYGANGFKLDFSNGAALGTDSSGNGNNWTLNGGITSANQYTDTPTNNYCVWNPLSLVTTATLSKGNTKTTASAVAIGTFGFSSGKPYWEISSATAITTSGMYSVTAGAASGSPTTTTTIAAGKTYGFRADIAAGTLDYINITDAGAWTSLATGLSASTYYPYVSTAASALATINGGSQAFAGTVPAGYSAANSVNLSASGTVTVSGTFTGNLNAAGPHIFCNGYPTTLTINGNAVTFGTHADRVANGFKLRTALAAYNNTGSNTWTATIVSNTKNLFKYANAQGNP